MSPKNTCGVFHGVVVSYNPVDTGTQQPFQLLQSTGASCSTEKTDTQSFQLADVSTSISTFENTASTASSLSHLSLVASSSF